MLVRKTKLLFSFNLTLYKRFIMNMIRFERSEHLYITELNGKNSKEKSNKKFRKIPFFEANDFSIKTYNKNSK